MQDQASRREPRTARQEFREDAGNERSSLGKISAETSGADPTSGKTAKRTRTSGSWGTQGLGHRSWGASRGASGARPLATGAACVQDGPGRWGLCREPLFLQFSDTYGERPVRVPGPGPHAGLSAGQRPVTQLRVRPESCTRNMGAEEANSSSAGPEPT